MKRCMMLLLLMFPLFASADVTFYTSCDYEGTGVSLAPGDYTAYELRSFGIAQDSISAVDIPRGLTVTLFADDLFRGRYGTLKRSDPCLVNDRFNNVVSSLFIRESFDVASAFEPEEPTVVSGVTLFTECGFKGSSAILGEGNYNLAQLQKLGVADNSVSSIKVDEGYSVTLYVNDFLRGLSGSSAEDHDCLKRALLDDVVSSVSVKRTAVDTATAASKPTPASTSAITLYPNCNYGGQPVNLNEGEYTASKLQNLGIANNTISSIRVSDGFQVELFENDFFLGSSGALRQNDNCLIDDRFNDAISSLIVTRVEKPQATTVESVVSDKRPVLTVFGSCNYKGGSVRLPTGRYDVQKLAQNRIGDNVISSFKLEKGYQVTVYDSSDFTGQGKTFSNSDVCLLDDRLDETISSLVIEPVKVAEVGKQFPEVANPGNPMAEMLEVNRALKCVGQYVSEGLCTSQYWPGIEQRCNVADVKLMSDGYLRGHVNAGNCRTEYWDELSRRVANPALR